MPKASQMEALGTSTQRTRQGRRSLCGAEAQADDVVYQVQRQVSETPAGADGQAQSLGALATSAKQMLRVGLLRCLAAAAKNCPSRQPGLEGRKLQPRSKMSQGRVN